MSNSLKRAAKDKQSVLDNLAKKKACIEKHCVMINTDEIELQYPEKLMILLYVCNYL